MFAGARWLAEPALDDMRTRHFDVLSGRFISRDSIGIWGDEENLGNGYTYVSNAPDTYVDPTGGRMWWGKYNNTRFNRIKNNFGKT